MFSSTHGAHRPVCGGRWLVAHVGSMNCVPWNFLLIVPPVAVWFTAGPPHSPCTRQTLTHRPRASARLFPTKADMPIVDGVRCSPRSYQCRHPRGDLPGAVRGDCVRGSLLCPAGCSSAGALTHCSVSLSVTLLAAHLTEPGILPTLVLDGAVYRPARTSAPQRYWPIGISSEPDSGRRAGRADASKARVVVLDSEHRSLKEFRAKVCRETEVAVENFDHFCPWVGNVCSLAILSVPSVLRLHLPALPRQLRSS
jgi:hypothetical protein